MSNPKKIKRVSVSSKRQISIPKEYYDLLGIGGEVNLELYGNHIVVKPVNENFDDFSENILQDLIEEGYNGPDLMREFKHRKSQMANAVSSMIEDAKANGKRTTIEDLFGEDEEWFLIWKLPQLQKNL